MFEDTGVFLKDVLIGDTQWIVVSCWNEEFLAASCSLKCRYF